jgi:hypothetical protein
MGKKQEVLDFVKKQGFVDDAAVRQAEVQVEVAYSNWQRAKPPTALTKRML